MVQTEQERWLRFFKEGGDLDGDALPSWMQTDEMRQAMSTVKQFSEKERAYHAYQARQTYLRIERDREQRLEALQNGLSQAQIAREAAEKKQALAEQTAEQDRTAREQAEQEARRQHDAREQAEQEKERERAEKEAALAEIERLKAALVDPSK